MEMPRNSPTLEAAIDALHRNYDIHEVSLIAQIDELLRSGIADKRWCAVARTSIEQGFMALHRALRDYPGDDPNQYGKVPQPIPPPNVRTPVDPEAHRTASRPAPPQVEWQDYKPGGE